MSDALDAMLDQIADRLAERVLARLDAAQRPDASTAVRTNEAAQLLRLSPTEVRRHLRSGELRSVRVGRVRLIPRRALDEFLERRAAS